MRLYWPWRNLCPFWLVSCLASWLVAGWAGWRAGWAGLVAAFAVWSMEQQADWEPYLQHSRRMFVFVLCLYSQTLSQTRGMKIKRLESAGGIGPEIAGVKVSRCLEASGTRGHAISFLFCSL